MYRSLILLSKFMGLVMNDLPQSYYELLLFLHSNTGDSVNILLTRKYEYQSVERLQSED